EAAGSCRFSRVPHTGSHMHAVLLILLVVVLAGIYFTYRRVGQMATKEELNAAVDGLETSLTAELTEIGNALTKIQEGGADDGVSPADLDQPIARLGALKTAIESATSSIRTALNEAPATTETGTTGTGTGEGSEV